MLNAFIGKFFLLIADILGITRISKNSFFAGSINVLLSFLLISMVVKSMDWAKMYMLFSSQWNTSPAIHYLLELNNNFFNIIPINFSLPWKN
jgi:hypothetical protein